MPNIELSPQSYIIKAIDYDDQGLRVELTSTTGKELTLHSKSEQRLKELEDRIAYLESILTERKKDETN